MLIPLTVLSNMEWSFDATVKPSEFLDAGWWLIHSVIEAHNKL